MGLECSTDMQQLQQRLLQVCPAYVQCCKCGTYLHSNREHLEGYTRHIMHGQHGSCHVRQHSQLAPGRASCCDAVAAAGASPHVLQLMQRFTLHVDCCSESGSAEAKLWVNQAHATWQQAGQSTSEGVPLLAGGQGQALLHQLHHG
jgi:hypothetical protein